MAKIDRVQEISIDLLRPYERNAKIHGDNQVEQIAESIKEFGFISPCLIDKDYNIIAGHGRVLASKKLGMEKIPCLFIEGLTEEQRRAYILADNRLTELGEWDDKLLNEELRYLTDSGFEVDTTGFNIDDIQFNDEEDVDIMEDLTETIEETLRVSKGEIWQLGNHRLMCGDSTNPDDVALLLDGEMMDMVETDPPYNVNVSNSNGDTIENDNLADNEFYTFLLSAFKNIDTFLKQGGAFYIWHADSNGGMFRNALEENGLRVRQNLIWVKSHFTIGRQDYQWRHEPCLYGWKDGAGHYFIDLRSLATTQEYDTIDKMSKEEILEAYKELLENCSTVMHEQVPLVNDLHPTMKPLSLIKKQIRNSSRERERVLDLFGGSGTTLIACEELNRKCYMMEYDPKYAGRIIKRWELQTGQQAKKVYG